ncbi:MAG: carbohydrate ABC transporter permease [Actinobacteria bacterium]|nr:carbohydrate ABC transporter permease [Actinomycetota bacterium]
MKQKIPKILSHIILIIWLLFAVFPLYWTFVTSFKKPIDVFQGPKYFPFIDFQPVLTAWKNLFIRDWAQILPPYMNSIIIATISAFLAVIIGSMASYALSRFRFRWRFFSNKDISFWIISQRFFPPIAIVIPVLILFRVLKLLDTRSGMIIVYTAFNLPFAIWLMKDYFESIPQDIEEAAMVDGCSRFQAFLKIVIPLAYPGLITAFLFSFVMSWNEFLFALILTFQNARTIPLIIAGQSTQRGIEWWNISVLAIITILPALLITIIIQKKLISGLTFGAIK